MVDYRELAPPAELSGLVHRIWVLRGDASGPARFQRAMPDGRAELIFNLGDPFECRVEGAVVTQPRALLVGPSLQAMEIRPTGAVDLIGVRLRPEALSAWLRVSGSELVDQAQEIEDVPLRLPRTLLEQLGNLGHEGHRLPVLQRELAKAARSVTHDRRLRAAVDLALADGRARPSEIARTVGMSHRQLHRLFRQRLGFGPKPLVRLGRFQRALRELDGIGRRPIASVALRAGYYDQAHLARDFRLFSGVSPARYLREARELARNFIADREEAGG